MFSPIDLTPILAAKNLSLYSAAKLVETKTGERFGTVYERLRQWAKGEPPKMAIVLRDLAVLGYTLKLVKLRKTHENNKNDQSNRI